MVRQDLVGDAVEPPDSLVAFGDLVEAAPRHGKHVRSSVFGVGSRDSPDEISKNLSVMIRYSESNRLSTPLPIPTAGSAMTRSLHDDASNCIHVRLDADLTPKYPSQESTLPDMKGMPATSRHSRETAPGEGPPKGSSPGAFITQRHSQTGSA